MSHEGDDVVGKGGTLGKSGSGINAYDGNWLFLLEEEKVPRLVAGVAARLDFVPVPPFANDTPPIWEELLARANTGRVGRPIEDAEDPGFAGLKEEEEICIDTGRRGRKVGGSDDKG